MPDVLDFDSNVHDLFANIYEIQYAASLHQFMGRLNPLPATIKMYLKMSPADIICCM